MSAEHMVPRLASEEDVRSRIILPLLHRMGIRSHNFQTEYKFRVRLGRTVVEVGRGRELDTLSGRADIVVIDDEGRNLFVVELKAYGAKLTREDRDQGISYARLLDQIAPFVLLTNGDEHELYDTISKSQIDLNEFPECSAYWRSGCDPTGIVDDSVRDNALQHFVGYSLDHVRAFSTAQQKMWMAPLRGGVGEQRKYLPDVYIPRSAVRQAFVRFLASPHVTFAIVGESGVGKTNEICALAEWAGENHLSLFFAASQLADSFSDTLADEFNWHFSEQLPLRQIAERLDRIGQRTRKPILIFTDAIDEADTLNFEAELSKIARQFGYYEGRLKLIVTAKRDDWSRFAEIRDTPSFLALSLFPTASHHPSDTDSPPVLGGTSKIEPFVLERLNAPEVAELSAKYFEKFHLQGELQGSLREHCRLPLILRFVSEVYGREGHPLPSDISEPELLRRFIDAQINKMRDGERARLELEAVGRALVKKSQLPAPAFETVADTHSVPESLVREEARLPATAPVAGELIAYNLLERRTGVDGQRLLRFYYGRMRDYVIARPVLQLDLLSTAELENRLPELLTTRVVQDAVLWHVQHGPRAHRELFNQVAQGRAALFLERYQSLLEELAPGLRSRIDPYIVGDIGLAYGVGPSGLYAWGFYPAERHLGNRLLVIHPDPDSTLEENRSKFWQNGIKTLRGGGKNFLNTDPVEVAHTLVWSGIWKAVKDGDLKELDSSVLAAETTLALANKIAQTLDFPKSADFFDWTAKLIPFDCNDALRRIYAHSGEQYYVQQWTYAESENPESPHVDRSGEWVSMTIPNEIQDDARVRARREAGAGRVFPVYGSWEIRRLTEAIFAVLSRQPMITEPLLPRPDRVLSDPDASFDAAYSDAKLTAYLETLFLSALQCYHELAVGNFGALSANFGLIKKGPPAAVVEYRRAKERRGSINDWGSITIALVPACGPHSWVDVHIDPREPVFRFFDNVIPTRRGELETIWGPRLQSVHDLVMGDGLPFGRESHGGTVLHTPIRSLAYDFLTGDLRDWVPEQVLSRSWI